MLRQFEVLGSGDCRVVLLLETHVSGRDIDAHLGLITCVWSRIGQMARRFTPERSRTRVQSDSSQWRRCGRVVADGEKTRRNGVKGTINKDMTNDEMTFLDTENRQALEPNV